VAYPDEMLRTAAERMATCHVYVLPVVEHGTGKVVGLLSAEDVLEGRVRTYERENKQARVRQPFRRRGKQAE
jgi:CBS domain-containing protein